MTEFIDCTSLNISYDTMGLATLTYTVVHDVVGFVTYKSISAGGQNFVGYIINASLNPIPGTVGWFETHCTLITTTT